MLSHCSYLFLNGSYIFRACLLHGPRCSCVLLYVSFAVLIQFAHVPMRSYMRPMRVLHISQNGPKYYSVFLHVHTSVLRRDCVFLYSSCIYVYMHVYMCVCICYIYIYICACVHVYMYICTCICVHIHSQHNELYFRICHIVSYISPTICLIAFST